MTGQLLEPELVGDEAERGDGLEIAVVGAGAVGATTTYELTRRGADVTLYERDGIASAASGRSAGICYDAFTEPIDAELANDSIERFRTLSGEESFPFVECPYVWFAREGAGRADAIADGIERMQRNGVVALELSGAELGDRFPALRTDDVAVAGIAGAAGYVDPTQYTETLATVGSALGATIRTGTTVGVRTDPPRVVPSRSQGREFDAVVVAAGAHTGRVLETADLSIAMKPYRVQALVADVDLAEPITYDVDEGAYLRPHSDGVLVGNGAKLVAADPEKADRTASDTFETAAREHAEHRLGRDAVDAVRSWAGLCTATPDQSPLVGRLREGLFVATGFHGHGLMRTPAVSQRLAEQVLGGSGIEGFDPTRFDGDEPFEIRDVV